MMGRNHAKQGICVAGITSVALAAIGLSPTEWPLIAALCAVLVIGGTQTPDMDSKGANATRVYGPITAAISVVVRGLSRLAYSSVRSRRDRPGKGTHRTLTHTLLGNLLSGGFLAGVSALGAIPTAVMVGGIAGIGAYAIKKRAVYPVALIAGVAAYLASDTNPLIWGAAFAIGSAVHCFGDSCTRSGVPYLWPLAINGKRWQEIHFLPERMRVYTGSSSEGVAMGVTYVATVLIIAGIIGASYFLRSFGG